MKTACFTGRRPKQLFGYNHDAYMPLFSEIKNLCAELVADHNVRTFISGGAQGVDQLAFWTVHDLKKQFPDVKNIVYIPFEGQDSRWLADGTFGRREYSLMLTLADGVYNVSGESHPQGNVASLLHERNHAMVDNADLVFAVYPHDIDPITHTGGTAECMRYAIKHGKDILQLDPMSLAVMHRQ